MPGPARRPAGPTGGTWRSAYVVCDPAGRTPVGGTEQTGLAPCPGCGTSVLIEPALTASVSTGDLAAVCPACHNEHLSATLTGRTAHLEEPPGG